MLRDWGIQPDAKNRALRKLEHAGLITVERRGKRSPLVTLVLGNGLKRDTVTRSGG
jgi:DNA-binding transcriptional ArsR family regulator